jgi:hypothetical protein
MGITIFVTLDTMHNHLNLPGDWNSVEVFDVIQDSYRFS